MSTTTLTPELAARLYPDQRQSVCQIREALVNRLHAAEISGGVTWCPHPAHLRGPAAQSMAGRGGKNPADLLTPAQLDRLRALADGHAMT